MESFTAQIPNSYADRIGAGIGLALANIANVYETKYMIRPQFHVYMSSQMAAMVRVECGARITARDDFRWVGLRIEGFDDTIASVNEWWGTAQGMSPEDLTVIAHSTSDWVAENHVPPISVTIGCADAVNRRQASGVIHADCEA